MDREELSLRYRVGSLFAGIGGICLGFKNAKVGNDSYQLKWANEVDEYAAYTYRNNFNHKMIVGDIEKVVKTERCINNEEFEQYKSMQEQILEEYIDVLTGGFPCQAFSIAGERKGFDDHRGNLFWSIIDLVKLHETKHGFKPKVLFMENVKNLQGHDNGRTYEVIKSELENAGYIVKEAVLNTMSYTEIPQNRERIFIVCFLNETHAKRFTFFDKDNGGRYINLENYRRFFSDQERETQIRNIISNEENTELMDKFYYTKDKYPHYFLSKEEYMKIDEEKRKSERINLSEQITKEYKFYQLRRGMYVRQNRSGVCPTLTANMGKGGHNVPLIKVKDGIRKITPSEAFKLQGFPVKPDGVPLRDGGDTYVLPEVYNKKGYSDAKLYVQAGNAVTVPIITIIANEILKALND
jgi:DNA (cytosine-5)-methyltransferase 1